MRKLFFLFLALVATTSLWAQTFQVGDLYYNITSGTTVEVTSGDYSGLTTATIPSTVTHNGTTYSVTSIGNSAFAYCSSLTSVTIPNSVTSIGDRAFGNCSSLTSVTIPKSITSIKSLAFDWCSSLSKTNYTGNIEGWCNIEFEDYWGNPLSQSHNFYINDQIVKELLIPNSVDSIHDYAFAGGSFTSIVCESTTPPILGIDALPYCVVYIPDNTLSAYQTAWGNEYAYVNNENTLTLHVATPGTLSDLIFDAGTRPVLVAKLILTGTLNDADFTCMRETMTSLVDVDLSGITNTSGVNFNAKSKLVKIILPTNLTSIGDDAFNDCDGLTSITIPNNVTSIGDFAFYDCDGLTSITIPNNVTSIGDFAFYHSESLTSITLPNSLISIGMNAFGLCRFTSVTIPNSVTSIGDGAFYFCESLTSITIGNSVTSIGDLAFSGCSSLTSIICLGTTPPDASNLGANTSTCKLIVPHSAYNAYLRHACWGQFLNIVADSWVVILNTNNNQWGEVAGGGMYTDNTTITITATPYDGYSFLRWSDGNTDNPRTLTVTKDITLTAEFVEYRDMTIIFTNSEDNDSEIYSQSLTLTIPAAPEIEGFTFLYWQPVAEPLTDVITIQAIYEADVLSSAPEVYINPANPAQKLLRNGQVYILKDDKIYTIMGAEIH